MIARIVPLLALSFALPALAPPRTVAADAQQPNIVIILADDIGYGDVGCYGATKVKTPNLDKLAAQGMRFTDAHAPSAVCTPTRYALMTGQYAWRHPPGSRILSGVAPLCIKPGTVTVPSLLKQAGYATGSVGKWHLGLGETEPDFNGELKPGPREVGFDYSFIIPATGDRVPCVYVENQRVVGLDPKDPIRVRYGTKVGDEPTGADSPNLLKLNTSQGHADTIVNGISRIGFMTGGKSARWKDEDMADELTRKAIGFIEKNKDRPFLLYFATHDVHVPRVPHPRFRGKSECGVRGDVIQEFDWSVGEVMATIDKLKLTDNTLVIFSSDNGGVMDDGYADGAVADANGHKCNGVLRGFKGGLYEGGTREPFIARWPGHVPAGKTSGELVCLVDMLATLAAVAGRDLPADAGPDSFNLLPALLAVKPARSCREQLVIHGGGRLAIRQGPWKFIPPGPMMRANPGELYNLDDDLAETKNLADKNLAKVRDLTALLKEVRESGRSRPQPAEQPKPTLVPPMRTLDLNVGESLDVELPGGKRVTVKLLNLRETRDDLRNAVRKAEVMVEVAGEKVSLVSANYRLPVTLAGVQIDCPVTKGYRQNNSKGVSGEDPWGLDKDARLRIWPAGAPLVNPGTFLYPAKQSWFASGTQMANEPTHVDGGENPQVKQIYYHYGLDIGGAEGLVEVVAATDGLVVSSGRTILPGYDDSPAKPRYDVVYLLDARGWYYRYSHLHTISPEVKPGEKVKMGQRIGILGKEGGSGGWSHLHFDISSRQPSGKWGIIEGYAFLWEAYLREQKPKLLAVARPHHLAAVGQKVVLDGSRSWSADGKIKSYDWTFNDGKTAAGSSVERTYSKPGVYSEVLKITDSEGRIDYDFAVVNVLDKEHPDRLPPSIHAVYSPTFGIKLGDPVTFLVRTFRTTDGKETWDYGDGSPKEEVRSDGNVIPLAKDGYARTIHRYEKPGHYLVRVERTDGRGFTAVGHLHVRVGVE